MTFLLSAIFLILGVALLGNMEREAPRAGVLPGALLGLVVSAVAAWGLSAGRDWARYASTPVLWIFVGAAVVNVLYALSQGVLNIPIVGIIAAWALSAKSSEALGPLPTQSAEGTLLVLGAIIAAVIQFF